MTKVSWKRILQRAGNDLPSSGRPLGDRPHLQAVPRTAQRLSRVAEAPTLVAGELETELRRALQRAQGMPSQEPQEEAWDPIFMSQEMRHAPVSPVPAAAYIHPTMQPRSHTIRNIVAISLSAVLVGVAVQQIGGSWSDNGGGGGGGSGGTGGGGTGQQRPAETASLAAPMSAKDKAKLVQTGYAIQPLIQPGSPTDLGPAYNEPSRSETKTLIPQESPAEAAANFRRDMEEARQMFDAKEEPPVVTAQVSPAIVRPATAPAQAAPVAAKASANPSAAALSQPSNGPAVSSAEENKLMQRAGDLMQRGDITGARLLFEHLAFRGSAIGAFALAQSYDPRYLQKLMVRGLTPDQKQADFWYRRAAELGTPTGRPKQ